METSLPAKKETPPITLKIGGSDLKIPQQANRFLLTRTSTGWTGDEIATLGESDVFVRRDASGALMLIHKTVRLYAEKKEIDRLGSKDTDPWVITVPGYNKLNQVAGVYISTPDILFVDGKDQSNPFVQYDAHGEIKRVIARKIAIGYSPVGNLVAIDTVRHYNFDAYYLQDLQGKARWKPDSAKFGTIITCPFDPSAEIGERNGYTYARAENGKVYTFKQIKDLEGIWIDITHEDVREVYSQHIQHQKFGEVIAQNLASRNALKAHPAIATSRVKVSGGIAEVTVYGWRHGMTEASMRAMASEITQGKQPENVVVQRETEDATYDEIQTVAETEIDDGTPSTEGGVPSESRQESRQSDGLFDASGKPQGSPTNTSDSANIACEINKIATEKGIDLVKMCKNLFQSRPENLTPEQKSKLLTVVQSVVSGKKGGAR